MSKPVTFAVVGAGGRGKVFSTWLKSHPDQGAVTTVAEPDEGRRRAVAEMFNLAPERVFTDWRELVQRPKLADAMINTTMDRLHAESSVAALDRGYHMLLEKPMATSLADCVAIDAARARNDRLVAICHTLRYHVLYAELKRMLDSGVIGRLVSLDQLEPVGAVHQSHSFVRGNWGNESRSTFMLMAKSCHDVDTIAWLVGRPCLRVSSFGSLTHFTKDNAPAGATARCTDGCPVEAECPYSALRIYVHGKGWYVPHAGLADLDLAQRLEALRTSPYGRCVYQCDNDVVDHQVVAFEFQDSITATFTMTAFAADGRQTRLHGTLGELRASIDSNTIELIRFSDGARQRLTIPHESGGHGGADARVIARFIEALRHNDAGRIATGTAESLRTHKIVFAAEQARREGRVVELSELDSPATPRSGADRVTALV